MRKYIMILGLLILTAGIMSACGSKQEIDVEDELGSIEGDLSQVSGGRGLVKLLGVKEDKVSYDVSGVSGEGCVVNADVDVPDAEHAAIYHQEMRQMTADAVKDFVIGLFEKGSCQAVKPFAAYKKKELEEAEENLKQQSLAIRKQARDEGRTDWMTPSRVFDYQFGEVQTLLEAYDEDPEVWTEDAFYIQRDGSQILIYQGLIDGKTYFFVAMADEQGSQVKLYLYGQEEPWYQESNLSGGSYDEMLIDEFNDTLYGKNLCTLSVEDAKQMAQTFLERFGLNNMVLVDTKNAVPSSKFHLWHDEEYGLDDEIYEGASDSAVPEGYSFHFVRSYEGVPLEYTIEENTWFLETEGEKKEKGELYHVVVNDQGVVYLAMEAIYDVKEALAEQAAMLTFEQIDKIAQEKLANIPDEVNLIAFRYKNVEYEGQSVLMPVWIYSNSYRIDSVSGDMRYPVLILNAVDGSEIAQ